MRPDIQVHATVVLVEKMRRTVWCNCPRNNQNSGLFARYFSDNFLGAAKVATRID